VAAIRFHLDEHISDHVAAGLRRRTIDVTTTAEAGMLSATDVKQLDFSASSGRVLVTHDADFLRLHARGTSHAGIAYCRQQSISVGEILRRLILMHDLLAPNEMANRVEFL
jgi:predicted nuclease of predicted toxin-antitoxin system